MSCLVLPHPLCVYLCAELGQNRKHSIQSRFDGWLEEPLRISGMRSVSGGLKNAVGLQTSTASLSVPAHLMCMFIQTETYYKHVCCTYSKEKPLPIGNCSTWLH